MKTLPSTTHPSDGFGFGAICRPIHITLATRTLFWHITDCTGLSSSIDYEPPCFHLRTPKEMRTGADWLMVIAGRFPDVKPGQALDLVFPGHSPEFTEESNEHYDATELALRGRRAMKGVRFELAPTDDGEDFAEMLTAADARMLAERLRTLAAAWDDGTLELGRVHPLGKPSKRKHS